MRDVPELLDAIDLVLTRADGIVPEELLGSARDYANDIRQRRGFLGETLVLATAGGTGTGKSSLLNALAGEVITSVSVLRPHTDEPLAVIPENPEPAVTVPRRLTFPRRRPLLLQAAASRWPNTATDPFQANAVVPICLKHWA